MWCTNYRRQDPLQVSFQKLPQAGLSWGPSNPPTYLQLKGPVSGRGEPLGPCFLLAALGLHCCERGLSSCRDWGLLSSWGARTSRCRAWAPGPAGSSSRGSGEQQLWPTGSRARAQSSRLLGLVAPRHVESSRIKNGTHVPCTGKQILTHWTTREVQLLSILDISPVSKMGGAQPNDTEGGRYKCVL